MTRRTSFSLGALFSLVIVSFLTIFLVQSGIGIYLRLRSELAGIQQKGEYFMQTADLLLKKQIERREHGLKAIVSGVSEACDDERDVLLAAIIDGNRITHVLKGWLPVGMVLPDQLLTDDWAVGDLVDVYGRNLFTCVRRVMGLKVFAAIRLDLNELDAYWDHSLLPVISDGLGKILWMGTSPVSPELSSHLSARGFIYQKRAGEEGWLNVLSHQGTRVMLRQEPLRYGLTFTAVYPLYPLLLSAASSLGVAGVMFVTALAIILLLWLVWQKGVLGSISQIAGLADEMSSRLSQIDARDPLRGAEVLFSVTRHFTELKTTFVKETNHLIRDLRGLFEVMLRQQEELTAFNQETEAMNQELEQVNNRLRNREGLWERTLDFSRAFARSQDVNTAISSTLDTIMGDLNAFGILISSVEADRFRLVAWSGYAEGLTQFTIEKTGIAATDAISSRSPIWIEDVRAHPTAYPVHPMVRSELLIPLFQAGEEEGVLEIAFDRPMRKDPFLIETLIPVASFLGGLVHGEKMRREVKASYAYLAEKLQFVTGLYHDETEAHIARIGKYCSLLAKEIGRDNMEQEDIELFARLHDIGKLRIPYGILIKPGPLTPGEFEQIKLHPRWGAEILGDAGWLRMARNICMTHHEKWDGSGYPLGLRGEEIPWEGRVATIADIYDALRSSRSYKPPLSHREAMHIMLVGDGRVQPEHFDPFVLTTFERISDQFAEIFAANSDERDTLDYVPPPM